MTLKEFAQSLDGREYNYPQFTKEEIQTAKNNGFVIVYGSSDDLMEFDGAIYDEGDCYNGGNVYFDRDGVRDSSAPNKIKAIWCSDNALDKNGQRIDWTYKTDIPHETYMIYDEGEPYCRGIVFSVNDLK